MPLTSGDKIAILQQKVFEIFMAEKSAASRWAFADRLIEVTPTDGPVGVAFAQGAVGLPTDTTDRDLEYEDVNYYSGNINVREFTLPIRVKLSAIEDDTMGWIPNATRAIARRMEDERRRLVLANMASPGNSVLNGTALYSDSHTLGAASIDNNITVTVSSTTAPTIADMQKVFDEAGGVMSEFPDDKGSPLGLLPDTIIVPSELRGLAFRALNGSGTPGSVAPMVPQQHSIDVGGWTVMANPHLTSTTVVYVASTMSGLKPFGWLDRVSPAMMEERRLTEREVTFFGRMRGARFAGDPRSIIKVTIST